MIKDSNHSMNWPEYDFIIAGAGCAGLSLAIHMIKSGKFSDKRILIIDKDEKNKNDRTWCFWETKAGLFDSIVQNRWKKVWIHNNNTSRLLTLQPYEYKLIKGIDFYEHCFSIIKKQNNFHIRYGTISNILNDQPGCSIFLNEEKIKAGYIFSSIMFSKPVLKAKEYYLLQHFKGWIIETNDPVFENETATLMDFRTDQTHGTAFVYVMPFSKTKALVEFTLFTKSLLEKEAYDQYLKEYITRILKTDSYKILDEEFGIIPMTNHKFPVNEGNIIFIGFAGGQTKASSGYTFRFIQKHSAAIVRKLVEGKSPIVNMTKKRFRFYDSVLLNILANNKLPGNRIFTTLFSRNKPVPVLRFLDNESSIAEELKIISSLPTLPFLKAATDQL